MANKGKRATKDLEVGEIVSKSEQFIEKYQNRIIYAVVGIALIAGAILGIHYGYLAPQEKKAAAAIFKGEQYFAKDSFALALHGNSSDYIGFLSIIDEYGTTKSANLSKAYAGICYFKTGEPNRAMEMLKGFKAKDQMISPAIVGLIGDCYVNASNYKEGISYFEKAANMANNEVISPVYLKKAGRAYEELKQYKDAVKVYTTIKEKYFNSEDASDIDKYIIRAQDLASK